MQHPSVLRNPANRIAQRAPAFALLAALAASGLAGCNKPVPYTPDEFPEPSATATSCKVDEAGSTEEGPMVLDCSEVPEETVRRIYKEEGFIPVTDLGECSIILAFMEPSEDSEIQTVFARECRETLA